VIEQLTAALAAEEAAIYAYGPVGVRLAGAARDDARAAEAAHRDRRDALVSRLDEQSAAPVPVSAGYALPFPVIDRASALRLAIRVEDAVAATWRAALPATAGTDRRTALTALTDAAVRATRWRRLAGVTPLTVPFPGKAP
jgi:ferritin-like protein